MAVAAGTNLLCRRLKQPGILGFLLAGLVVGPYIPIPLFADAGRIHALSEFGVVLVMFVIGLEFKLSHLFKVLPVAGFAALIQIGTLLWFGFSLGHFFGWDSVTALFLGAGICISSTMLVSNIFQERPVTKEVRNLVLGVLVLQDVAAIALITAMTAVAETGAFSFAGLALTLGKLILALVLMVALGLLVVPRLVRYVLALKSSEALIVTVSGLCFGMAAVAEELGYSVALGAFVAGLLVSESGHGHEVEESVKSLKNMFAAVFFVSIGMTVDPALALANIGPALLVFAGVVFFQLLSISIAAILSGNGVSVSLTAGLSLGQIGEFGFIITAIGTTAGVVAPQLQPILVTVAVLTAFTTPMALNRAPRVVNFVDRHLPNRFKHLLAVYEGWLEGVRQTKGTVAHPPSRRALRAIILDVVAWLLVMFLFLYHFDLLVMWLRDYTSLPAPFRVPITYLCLVLLSIPPVFGLVRNTRHLEDALMESVNRQRTSKRSSWTTAGAAMMRAAIRAAVIMGAGIPAMALLVFLGHSFELGFIIAAGIFIMLALFWRSAGRLEFEVRSEAERLLAFLDSRRADDTPKETPTKPFFPNLGTMKAVYLESQSPSVGKTLTELNLRAVTGALVVAVHRDGRDIALPTGSLVLEVDDLVFLTGTTTAVEKAGKLLSVSDESNTKDP